MAKTYSQLPAAVTQALRALGEDVTQLLSPAEADIEALERALSEGLARLGVVIMGEALARLDPAGEDVRIDGRRYWQAVRATRRYMTQFGPVTVERGVYRRVRNGPTLCPLEVRAGVVEGFWTPRAAKLAALCISDMTPSRAEAFFKEFGLMQPSRSSLDRLPKRINKRWEDDRVRYEKRLRALERVPADAASVGVSLDGVMVSMRGDARAERKAATRRQGRAAKGPAGYREAGCATLTFYDSKGERLATRRTARMPEANKETLKKQLRCELDRVRAERPDLVVVGVADGAANNWDYLSGLPCDHEVVDYFHAVDHLKRALDVCMGASSLATQAKFSHLRAKLRDGLGGVDEVIKELKKLRSRRRGDHRDYRRGVSYFERHRGRMKYAQLQARALPIGSGVIEGACKSLASDRLKRAGMRWDHAGGQAVLNLRAWVQSDRFDSAWSLLQENYRREVIEIRAVA